MATRELSQSDTAIKQREAYAANPVAYREQAYEWRKRNPQKTDLWAKRNRAKINARAAVRRAANPEKHRAAVRRHYLKNITKALANAARQRARRLGLECTIDAPDIAIPLVCPVFGIPIIPANGRMSDNSPSVDRIDSTRGYTPDNILVVSWRANRLKSDATLGEMVALVKFYQEILLGKSP